MARGNSTRPVVLEALVKRAGKIVFAADLAAATDLTELQVKAAAYSLAKADCGVEIIEAAHAWRYSDPQVVSKQLPYTLVGTTKAGAVLVEGEDGQLYKLVKI